MGKPLPSHQPGLFTQDPARDQLLQQLQQHTAWGWLWFMCNHINTISSKPIKGGQQHILTQILSSHVDHLSDLFSGWRAGEGWPQQEVDALNDLSKILKQNADTLKAGPA